MSTVNNTINSLSNYCTQTTGDHQTWQGNKATYRWNIGKFAQDGTLNGVVRKFVTLENAVFADYNKISVVAGSFKIAPDGTILRFTGLPKKTQVLIQTSVVHTRDLEQA
jgi:hypothetical protein